MDFVPGGVVVDGGIEATGTALTDGRTLVEKVWSPGESVKIVGKSGVAEGTAPGQPTCLALFYLGLGDGEVFVGDQFSIFREIEPVYDVGSRRKLGYHVDILGWLEVSSRDCDVRSCRMHFRI